MRPIGYVWRLSRSARLLAASCAAVGLSPAEAQHAADADDVSAATGHEHLTDIIVTAQRRPEKLQRTPLSVLALSADDLASRSVTNLRTLQNFVPNLTFAPSQNIGEAAANVFIRGIGQEDFVAGSEAGVGVYIDGIFLPRSFGAVMNVLDVNRIEVLRGPQGTLFGRNTIGGAINVISVLPQPNSERRASVIFGNLNRVELRSTVNQPLSPRLLARISVNAVSRSGHLTRLNPPAGAGPIAQASHSRVDLNREGDENSQGIRLQLRWLTSERLTADISFDASLRLQGQGAIHVDQIDPRFGIFPRINALIAQGKLPGPQIDASLVRKDLLESFAANGDLTSQGFWGVSFVVDRQMGETDLKLITSYRGLRSHVRTDDDGTYFQIAGSDLAVRQHQFSGELQFNGRRGDLNYTVGVYGFFEKSRLVPTPPVLDILYSCGCFYDPSDLPPIFVEPRTNRSWSYAAYAQATYVFSDELRATLGLRYTRDRKALEGRALLIGSDLRPTGVVVATGSAEDRWNALTYRGAIEYRPAVDLMSYASIARGYKSGGFNTRGDSTLPNMGFAPFRPETATTYELGLRSEWLGRRLRVNATLFDTEYDDIQLRQQTIFGRLVTTLIENAAKARIRGLELELAATPSPGLEVGLAYGHLDPKYLEVGRVRGLTLDSRFQRTPSDSLAMWADYRAKLRQGTLRLHGDFTYRSKEQFQIAAAANDQSGYGLLAARIEFKPRSEQWSVAIFGTNLTDRRYRTAGRGTLIQQIGFSYSSIGLPRQFGIELASHF